MELNSSLESLFSKTVFVKGQRRTFEEVVGMQAVAAWTPEMSRELAGSRDHREPEEMAQDSQEAVARPLEKAAAADEPLGKKTVPLKSIEAGDFLTALLLDRLAPDGAS